jgi:hypothetical protein
MRDHPVSLKIALLVAFVAFVTPVHANDPTGQYANSPNAAWFGRQHNADGSWCCDGADGHLYYGAYAINADGSVTLPLDSGDTLKIDAVKVLPFNPTDPNPMGTAVWWYGSTPAATYCFALGPLT